MAGLCTSQRQLRGNQSRASIPNSSKSSQAQPNTTAYPVRNALFDNYASSAASDSRTPSPIPAMRDITPKRAAIEIGLEVANIIKTPTKGPPRSNQGSRDNSHLPCPKRQRLTRASTHSSKAVDYSMKYHPIDEFLRPNYPATLQHRFKFLSKEAQAQREDVHADANDINNKIQALNAKIEPENLNISKPKLSKTNSRVTRTRKIWDKRKYNMKYHPLDDAFPKSPKNKVSAWLRTVSVPSVAGRFTNPEIPSTNTNTSPNELSHQNCDEVREIPESPNFSLQTPPDLDTTPSKSKTNNPFFLPPINIERPAKKPKPSQTVFQVREDSPGDTARVNKQISRHPKSPGTDVPKENFVAEASHIQNGFPLEHPGRSVNSTSLRSDHFRAIRTVEPSETHHGPFLRTAEPSTLVTPWLSHATAQEAILPIFIPARRFVRPTATDFL